MLDPAGAMAELSVTVQYLDGRADIAVVGELDISTTALLRSRLERLILAGHRQLRINASGLRFLDAAGIGVLVQIRNQVEELGGFLLLHSLQNLPLRLIELCGLLDTLTEVGRDSDLPETGKTR
jgi:anti-sigma B factor antagonist